MSERTLEPWEVAALEDREFYRPFAIEVAPCRCWRIHGSATDSYDPTDNRRHPPDSPPPSQPGDEA